MPCRFPALNEQAATQGLLVDVRGIVMTENRVFWTPSERVLP